MNDARIRLDPEELEFIIEGLRKLVLAKRKRPYKLEELLFRLERYAQHGLTGRTSWAGGHVYVRDERVRKKLLGEETEEPIEDLPQV